MYTLILTNLVSKETTDGLVIDDLWAIDIEEHTRYIDQLRIVGRCERSVKLIPTRPNSQSHSNTPIGCNWGAEFQWVRGWRTGREFVQFFFSNFLILRKFVRDATIVHTGVVGWPIPDGYYVIPLAVLYRKKIVVVLESGDWSVPALSFVGFFDYLKARLKRWWTRLLLNRCCFVVSTNHGYFQQLKLSDSLPKTVIPASWISDSDVVPVELLDLSLKEVSGERFAFFGRLTQNKGIFILIAALKDLARTGDSLHIDIYGAGELEPRLKKLTEELNGSAVHVRVMGLVDYGKSFFETLDNYSTVIVPTVSLEQPRIIYDCFARAKLVIASNTIGNVEVIEHGKNGILFTSTDHFALADAVRGVLTGQTEVTSVRKTARLTAIEHTHQEMHRKRHKLLKEHVGL